MQPFLPTAAARLRAAEVRILRNGGLVITLSVYLLRVLYQFPPLCSSVDGILLRVSCIFVTDGAKNGLQGEDSLEVEPLVCRVRVMWCKVVFCALVTIQPES